MIGLLLAAVGALALVAAGCGGDDKSSSSGGGGGGGNVTALCRLRRAARSSTKGSGDPDYLIASDLPHAGRLAHADDADGRRRSPTCSTSRTGRPATTRSPSRPATTPLPSSAKWDPDKCSANAHAYAQNSKLLGVVGTFNSGCAAIEIPVLNQAPGGGLAMLSPANTYGCLTEPCAGNEPEKYYPSGKRNYARVAPSDPNQGAVDAKFMKSARASSASTVLNDKEAYGLGVAKNFQGAAKAAGMTVTGFAAYDPKQAELPGHVHEDQGHRTLTRSSSAA